MKKIKVVELFAGVGGFRIGLDRASDKILKYETVWSSQWEPGSTKQFASEIYIHNFGSENHSCEDIQEVVEKKFKVIPNHDLLVGGFPCQDYSVARSLNQAKGIRGKKGVLWWSIFNIIHKKGGNAPRYLILENVDRLLKSPSKQRGRDFAVMLASLADLGYIVEWRVINAADYGFPQRRKRVFIVGYKKGLNNLITLNEDSVISDWIQKNGVIAQAFPVKNNLDKMNTFEIIGNLEEVSENFSSDTPTTSPFENSGIMIDRRIFTVNTQPEFMGKFTLLSELILDETEVPDEFFIKESELTKWEYLKGGKKERRKTKDGYEYSYSEGSMVFPDSLDKPSRTIVTGEGGSSPSRFKHVIKTKSGRLRRLVPLELERLNMFPDNHTSTLLNNKVTPNIKRAFIMGNALVVGVVEKIGKSLANFDKKTISKPR